MKGNDTYMYNLRQIDESLDIFYEKFLDCLRLRISMDIHIDFRKGFFRMTHIILMHGFRLFLLR